MVVSLVVIDHQLPALHGGSRRTWLVVETIRKKVSTSLAGSKVDHHVVDASLMTINAILLYADGEQRYLLKRFICTKDQSHKSSLEVEDNFLR